MKIGTWNVQGISNKIKEVTESVEKINIDIAILTETKKKGQGCDSADNYIYFWSGKHKAERAAAGVAIMIHKRYKNAVTDVEYTSERLMSITIKIYGKEYCIVAAYAPTEDSTIAVKDDFYEVLTNKLDTVRNTRRLILAGDINARVGQRKNDQVVGRWGEDIVNDNGNRCIQMCQQYELKIANTHFRHKDIHKYTWERPSLQQKSIIDYIVVHQQTQFKINDVRVKRGATCGSDHFLLVADVTFPFMRTSLDTKSDTKPDKEERQPKYKIHLLQEESIIYLYQKRLEEKLMRNEATEEVEADHQTILDNVHLAAKEAIGTLESKGRPNQMWWNEKLESMSASKNLAYANWLSCRTEEKESEYRQKNRTLKKEVRKSKSEMWERRCMQIESQIGGTRSTEVWRVIKSMKTNTKNKRQNTIKIEEWKKHYENLLVENRDEYRLESETETEHAVLDITKEEVLKALKTMKNGKAAGPGGVVVELLKNGGDILINRITSLFNICVRNRKTPQIFKESQIISIYKKGSRKEPKNYRGLSINSTLSRLYGKILEGKLRTIADKKISEEQSGFTAGKSCSDNLFTLQQIIAKRNSTGQDTHLAFIDLEKAYDSVPRRKMWETLKSMEIEDPLVEAIKELYKENESEIKVGPDTIRIFPTKGLRQGCPLSPILFNLYLENCLKEWKTSCGPMGIPIGDNLIFTLSFADDQVVLAQDAYDMEFMLRRLHNTYTKWGLNINFNKTEYMVTGTEANFQILIDDDIEVKQVENFKYLGCTISRDGIGKEEVRNKVEQGKKVVGCLNSIWWDKHIRKEVKKRIGRTMVESVMTYGAEVWTMGAEEKRRINTVEMDYLRRSARKSRIERVRNVDIRRIMEAEQTLVERVEVKGLKWFGHVLRMNNDRWPRRAWEWQPPGRRKRGRPRRSWNDNMREAMRTRHLEEEDALERQGWRVGVGRRHLAV